MIEDDIEKYLDKQVKAAGGETRKCKWLGRRGAPDRYVMLNGGHWVELKRPGKNTADAHQEREHNRFNEYGVPVHLISTKEGVDTFIEEILNGA